MNEAATRQARLVIQRTSDRRGVVLRLSGELDLATAPELDRQLCELGGTNPGRLLLDLRGLEFIDSVGLAAILRAQRSAASAGYPFSLRRGARQVQRLFELLEISDRLTFED